jgi:hypothetical protein
VSEKWGLVNFGELAAPSGTAPLKNAMPRCDRETGSSNDQGKGATQTPWGRPPWIVNFRQNLGGARLARKGGI